MNLDNELNDMRLSVRRQNAGNSDTASRFPQQGQLDWVAFFRGVAEASIAMLSRLSNYGIEPLTVLVGQELCRNFRLSRGGEVFLTTALQSLNSASSMGELLWFGFGIRHVTRDLARTREGLSCIGLCAALSESHSIELSGHILSAYADAFQTPQQLSPSISQWTALVRSCSGMLAKTTFPEKVTNILYLSHGSHNISNVSNPQQIAEALIALSKVSSGELYKARFAGGSECAWLGVVADLLLGLKVTFCTDDNQILHQSSTTPDAQVTFIFDTDSHSAEATSEDQSVRKVQHAYRLDTISTVIRHRVDLGNDDDILCRVRWGRVLECIVGLKTLAMLQQMVSVICRALRNVAVIFEAVSTPNSDIDQSYRDTNTLYPESSYGLGFLNTIANLFPEIATEKKANLSDGLRIGYEKACMDYEAMIIQLSTACNCVDHTRDTENFSTHCLVGIFEFMISIACISSRLAVDEKLMPSVRGLRLILQNVEIQADVTPEMSSLERLLFYRTMEIYESPVLLYSGKTWDRKNEGQKWQTSALSIQGICYYLGALRGLSENLDLLSRLYVLPGSIETENRRMSEVCDEELKVFSFPASETFRTTSLPEPDPGTYIKLSVTPTLWVSEQKFYFSYNIESSKGCYRISPAGLVIALNRSRGLVACGLVRCRARHDISPITVVKGEGHYEHNKQQQDCIVRMVQREGPLWSVVFMDTLGHAQRISDKVILLEDECLLCAVKTVLSKGDSGFTIIKKV